MKKIKMIPKILTKIKTILVIVTLPMMKMILIIVALAMMKLMLRKNMMTKN